MVLHGDGTRLKRNIKMTLNMRNGLFHVMINERDEFGVKNIDFKTYALLSIYVRYYTFVIPYFH